jgi:signal transduction histidine kinase
MISITRNFFFWTILTLVVVLVFGAVMIWRAMAHERSLLKIKSDFVSSVSHEFKSPLTSIRALTDRMQAGKVKEEAKRMEYFSIISQDVDRLSRLVTNILDFSKIEEGKKEYEFLETDIAKWLGRTVEKYRKTETSKGMNFHLDVDNNCPHILMDSNALSQVLYNLMDNAVKFSGEKSEIHIKLTSNEEQITLEVMDEGIGIDREDMEQIFDKFYQGRNATQHAVQGTGLGLTLVKHVVEAHDGSISVESDVGKGSNFKIIIPVRQKREIYVQNHSRRRR